MQTSNESLPALEMIVIGNELLDGRTHEGNSYYLAGRCRTRGVHLTRVTVVEDSPEIIASTIVRATERSTLIVTCGGLGPTSDDRTRQAISNVVEQPLELVPEVRQRLAEKYQSRGRMLNATNLRQAYFPRGATVLPSTVGTADPFEVAWHDATLICLPGIPGEFRPLADRYVLDRHTGTDPRTYHRFHLFGRGESFYAQRIEELKIPSCLTISYNAAFPIVDIELSGAGHTETLEDARAHIAHELKPWLFAGETRTPVEELGELLTSRELSIATAESCTGGWVSNALTDLPGASAYLERSFVTYSNQAKIEMLGVSEETLYAKGAVSSETVREMAEGVRRVSGADLGIGISGIAGPTGGTEEKPVGTVYIAVANEVQTVVVHARFKDKTRASFKQLAGTASVMLAIRLLVERLSDVEQYLGIQSCTTFLHSDNPQ